MFKEIKVGDKIQWKASGKVARLEGTHGKMVTGVVQEVGVDSVTVLPDHRTLAGAMFPKCAVDVEFYQIMAVLP